jgi:hypothetical protein
MIPDENVANDMGLAQMAIAIWNIAAERVTTKPHLQEGLPGYEVKQKGDT